MDVTGANREVVLRVKIEQDPTNAATLARMAAEVEAAKKTMGRPVSIGVRGGGASPINYDPKDPLSMFEGEKWLPDIRKGLAANAARTAGGGAAAAGVGGIGLLGGVSAGGAAVAGLGAAAYSAYDSFWGNRTLAQTGIGRTGGGWLQSGWQGLANVGNFFTTSGDYFDPLGTTRAGKLDKQQAGIERARRDSDIYRQRDQQIAEVNREGNLSLQNRNADAGNFNALTGLDRSLYDNQRAQRMANLYGGNQEGLARAQLDLIGNRSALSRAPDLTRVQNEITSLQNIKDPTTDNARQLNDVLERQRRLKMEIAQETIKSLEATRQERSERAQAIREQGMSQKERFGNLDDFQQQEIIDAKDRVDRNESTIGDRRLLLDYGDEETKQKLKQQALANAAAFPFDAGFERDANRQENIAREIEVRLQDQRQVELNISMEKDPTGEKQAAMIVDAVVKYLELRTAEIEKRAGVLLNAQNN
jgi:hypothetical protein